jgi:hypothetical protein
LRGRYSFDDKKLAKPAARALAGYTFIKENLFLTKRRSPGFDGYLLDCAPAYHRQRAYYVDVFLYNRRARTYIPLKRFVSASPAPIEAALPDSTVVPSWRGNFLLFSHDAPLPRLGSIFELLRRFSSSYLAAPLCALETMRVRTPFLREKWLGELSLIRRGSSRAAFPVGRPLRLFSRAIKSAAARRASERDPASRAFRSDGTALNIPLGAYVNNTISTGRAAPESGQFYELADIERPAALTLGGRFGPRAFEERTLILNLTSAFYKVFGVRFTIFYYPLHRVFESDAVMQSLASGALAFLRTYITRQTQAQLWLSDFILLYYASVYLRTTDRLTRFIAKRLTVDKR